MSVSWNDSFLMNLPVIDAQHKQIIAALDDLETALSKGISSTQVEELLVRAQHYVARHFSIEERYMEESGYPGLVRQQEAHQEFSEKFARLLSDYRTGGFSQALVNSLHHELSHWIKEHVTGLDQSFGRYYRHYRQELPGDDQPPS